MRSRGCWQAQAITSQSPGASRQSPTWRGVSWAVTGCHPQRGDGPALLARAGHEKARIRAPSGSGRLRGGGFGHLPKVTRSRFGNDRYLFGPVPGRPLLADLGHPFGFGFLSGPACLLCEAVAFAPDFMTLALRHTSSYTQLRLLRQCRTPGISLAANIPANVVSRPYPVVAVQAFMVPVRYWFCFAGHPIRAKWNRNLPMRINSNALVGFRLLPAWL